MALFVIAFQFLLIYLFDVGLWMIFCLVIYQIIASAYGVYSYCMLEEMNINKNYTKFNVFISSVSAIFAVPVSVFLLFPFFGKILILYQHLTIYSILIIIHPTKAE